MFLLFRIKKLRDVCENINILILTPFIIIMADSHGRAELGDVRISDCDWFRKIMFEMFEILIQGRFIFFFCFGART